MISSVGNLQLPVSLGLFLKDWKPKSRGILEQSPTTTSAVTSIVTSGILSKHSYICVYIYN